MHLDDVLSRGRSHRSFSLDNSTTPAAATPTLTTIDQVENGDDDPIAWYGDFSRRSLETIMEEPRTPLPTTPQPIYSPKLPSSQQEHGYRHSQQDVFGQKERTPEPQSSSSSLGSLYKAETFIENPVDFPDGGLRAWLVVGAAATAHFCTVGVVIGCAGAWSDMYARQSLEVAATAANMAVIPAAMMCAMLLSASFFNYQHDRYPPSWLLPIASLLFALFICLASVFSTTYSAIVATHFISGIAAGAILSAATSVVESWFLSRRGLALALASLGGPIGGSVLPAALLSLEGVIGIDWAIRVVGFVVLVLLGIVCIAARTKYSRRHGGRVRRRPLTWAAYRVSLTETPYLLLMGSTILVVWGSMIPLTLIIFQARQLALAKPVTTLLLPVFSLGALAAQLASPYASCTLGRFNITVAGTLLGSILALGLWTPLSTPAALATTMAILGFSAGMFVSGVPDLVDVSMPEALRTRPGCAFRARIGLVLVAAGAAAMVGVPAAGVVIRSNQTGDAFLGPKIICGASFLLASVLLFFMRCLVAGPKTVRA